MADLGKAAIFDAGKTKPSDAWRKITVPGSTEVLIEKPPLGAHEKWVDANGHVVFIKMVCGISAIADVRYATRMRREQRNAGGIPYAKCPLRDELSDLAESNFPSELGKPCTMKDKRGAIYGYHQSCPHVEHVTAQRQAKNAAHGKKREDIRRRAEIRQEKQDALMEVQNAKLSNVLDKLVDNLPEKPKGGKRG